MNVKFIKVCLAHELLTTKELTNAQFTKQLFFNNSKLDLQSYD